MDDTTQDFLKTVALGQVRHLLTVAAGALIAKGALQSDQQGAFIQMGLGFASWAIVAIWSWWQKDGQKMVADDLAKLRGHVQNIPAVPGTPAAVQTAVTIAKNATVPVLMLAVLLFGGGADAQTRKLPLRAHPVQRAAPVQAAPPFCDLLRLIPGCRYEPSAAATDAKPLDIFQQIAQAALPDLEYAKMLSDAAGTPAAKVRGQCWDALITSNKRLVGDPSRVPIPDPGLASHAELFAEAVDDLDLKGPLFVGCSGAAQLFKTTILQLIAGFLTGASGLAALGVT